MATSNSTPTNDGDSEKLVHFIFPRDATPEEIAQSLRDLAARQGIQQAGEPDDSGATSKPE
jgi:hypothetical protein